MNYSMALLLFALSSGAWGHSDISNHQSSNFIEIFKSGSECKEYPVGPKRDACKSAKVSARFVDRKPASSNKADPLKAWKGAIVNFLNSDVVACNDYCNWSAANIPTTACSSGNKRVQSGHAGCLALFAGKNGKVASEECIESFVNKIKNEDKARKPAENSDHGKSACKAAMTDLLGAYQSYLESIK